MQYLQCMLASSACEVFSRINHMLDHKHNLKRSSKLYVMYTIFVSLSQWIRNRNKQKETITYTNPWGLHSSLLNTESLKKIEREVRKFLKIKENRYAI